MLELCDYIRRYPPPHLALQQLTRLVAAALGAKTNEPPPPGRPPAPQLSDAEKLLMHQLPPKAFAGLPPDVQALARERSSRGR